MRDNTSSEAAEQQVSRLPDADMQAVPKALTRAAQRAREIAERAGTKLVVFDPEENDAPAEKS